MIEIHLVLLLAWTVCCIHAGQVWELKRSQREDLNQRDAWADRYEKGTHHAS